MLRNQKSEEKNAQGKALLLEIGYNVPGGKAVSLKVFEGDDPHELAVKFCEEHNLHEDDDID